MARSFLYKLFLSTIGSMPSQYDPEVDSWWGIILTEFGFSDPFREENVSYFLVNFFGAFIFALVLCGLSLGYLFKDMSKGRDDARDYCTKSAYEYSDLHNQLRDTENELYHAHERLQDANSDTDVERKEYRDTIQKLNDQHLDDQEKIRSMEQHVSNTECDSDEYKRRIDYTVRKAKTLERKNQELERENGQFVASLTEKDEKINCLQAQRNDTTGESCAAVSSSPKYIQLNEEEDRHTIPEQSVAESNERTRDLERQNGTSASEIHDLRADLENLRDEHGKCSDNLATHLAEKNKELSILQAEKKTADENSAKAFTALQAELGHKEQALKEANEDLETRRRRFTDLEHDDEELKRTHATCKEHKSQASQLNQQLRDENGSLKARNNDLLQQLERAKPKLADTTGNGQGMEQQNQTLLNLRTRSQSENLSLQAEVQTLTQTVENQEEEIHTLKTNCPQCQNLRVALDAVERDVKMSDDESRAELERQLREELKSQVPDDLRRQLRGEVERSLREEFQKHYSNVLARNSKRMQEQDRLINEKDTELGKVKTNPVVHVDHAACEKKEGNLLASINKLKQDARILQGNCSRLNKNAQRDREQLNSAKTANDDLKRELETIKADQRRGQHINPLQGKLAACQRESEKMKDDRDKARNNSSIYSEKLSELRKKYEALEKEHSMLRERGSLDGDSQMEDGCNERLATGQNEQTITKLQTEIARLSKELEDRKARDDARDQVLPVDEGEQQWPEGRFPEDQSSTAPATNRDEAVALDVFRREIELREARDGKKAVYAVPAASACAPQVPEGGLKQSSAQESGAMTDNMASPPTDVGDKPDGELEEGKILDKKPPGALGVQHAGLDQAVPEEIAGKKRERGAYSDEEADEEGGDDRKKVKIYHLRASRDSSAPAQGDKL